VSSSTSSSSLLGFCYQCCCDRGCDTIITCTCTCTCACITSSSSSFTAGDHARNHCFRYCIVFRHTVTLSLSLSLSCFLLFCMKQTCDAKVAKANTFNFQLSKHEVLKRRRKKNENVYVGLLRGERLTRLTRYKQHTTTRQR
jgi:hypothetical protein